MSRGFFITGTDTGVGKTCATIALMHALQRQGKTILAMKPVAAGCLMHEGELKNDDALALQFHASLPLPYPLINPYAYAEPISPHIAGIHNPVQLAVVTRQFALLKSQSDCVLVEGAGGWFSPINSGQSNADLAAALALPVILVVAIRLGCINHARLSLMAIRQSGLPLVGWIAACTGPDAAYQQDNIAFINTCLAVPLLGFLPYLSNLDFDFLANQLDISALDISCPPSIS